MIPFYSPCKEVIITSLWLSFDPPSMTPGESQIEWYHYYCSGLYLFKVDKLVLFGMSKQRHYPLKSCNVAV